MMGRWIAYIFGVYFGSTAIMSIFVSIFGPRRETEKKTTPFIKPNPQNGHPVSKFIGKPKKKSFHSYEQVA